jgi:hypothetical protein
MGAKFSALFQTGPEARQSSYTCTISTRAFLGIKRPGRRVDHPTAYRAEVKERVYLTSNPLWAFISCSSLNVTFLYSFIFL